MLLQAAGHSGQLKPRKENKKQPPSGRLPCDT
jgi:hypothetical protein